MRPITPIKALDAEVRAQPSKAHTLRAIFCAALSDGTCTITNPLLGEDQHLAISALQNLGVRIEMLQGKLNIHGLGGKFTPLVDTVFIGNSGVTARFLTALSSLATSEVIIDGDERMRTGRPLTDLIDALEPLGVTVETMSGNGCPPVKVPGHSFNGGSTVLRGDKSSQYFSAILMTAPYGKIDTYLGADGEIISKPYIDITIDMMKRFGVEVKEGNGYMVPANQTYKAIEYQVEGDYSSAAFFFCAAAITGGKIRVTDLDQKTKQGDKRIVDILEEMGCSVVRGADFIELTGGQLKNLDLDMGDCPDIVVPLAVVAAFSEGTMWMRNIGHLRYKECDRIGVPAEELGKMGIQAQALPGAIKIVGGIPKGAVIDSHNDHRIAMSFALAGLKVPGVSIENPEAVKKSFPTFFDELEKLA